MNVHRTRVIALAAAAAALLAAMAIQAVPNASGAATPVQEQVQGNEPTAPASAVRAQYNDLAATPLDATWGGVFSAHWR